MQNPGKFDWEKAPKAFNDLCDEAQAALDHIDIAAKQFKAAYAAEHGIDPAHVDVWAFGSTDALVPIIRPQRTR